MKKLVKFTKFSFLKTLAKNLLFRFRVYYQLSLSWVPCALTFFFFHVREKTEL